LENKWIHMQKENTANATKDSAFTYTSH
jgi:hypothetical protein